jgi:hypothetical protein
MIMYSKSWILCSLHFHFSQFYVSFHDSHQIFHKNNVTVSENDVLSTHFLDYTFKFSINWLIVVILSTFNWKSSK